MSHTMARSLRFAVSVHILTFLAWKSRDHQVVSSGHLATSVNTNPVVVRRLVGRLQRAGLVKVTAGPGGGARLARAPEAITLRDIFDAVVSHPLVESHPQPNVNCPVGRSIGAILDETARGLDHAARAVLEERTIADLCERLRFTQPTPTMTPPPFYPTLGTRLRAGRQGRVAHEDRSSGYG
jgi:Rrf2 family protein